MVDGFSSAPQELQEMIAAVKESEYTTLARARVLESRDLDGQPIHVSAAVAAGQAKKLERRIQVMPEVQTVGSEPSARVKCFGCLTSYLTLACAYRWLR